MSLHDDPNDFHVRALLEHVGFEHKQTNQGDLDEAIRWALVELVLLRKEKAQAWFTDEEPVQGALAWQPK